MSQMIESQENQGKGNILIIDDNPTNLQLLSKILVEEGYNVRCSRESSMVVAGVKALPPDLILLDVVMPDMNGFDVCKLLKKDPQTAGVPVLFISAFDDIDSKVKAFEAGGVDFITKPFQYREIVERVKTQITLFKQHNELELHRSHLEQLVDMRTKEISDINQKLIWEINERVRAEIELQDLKRYNELILESAGEGICGLDKTGHIITINPAGAKTLGWDQNELIGKSVQLITNKPDEYHEKFDIKDCPICQCIIDGMIHQGDDQLFWRRDGSNIPIDFSSTPIVDEKKNIIGAVIIFQEIIERKRQDRLRETTISIAAALRRATTKSQLASEILTRLSNYITMDGGTILTHDGITKEIVIEATTGNLAVTPGMRFPLCPELEEYLLDHGNAIVYENGHAIISQLFSEKGEKSIAMVPFITRSELLGLLIFSSSKPILEDDLMTLNAIADMTSSSLRRIQLHEQTEKRLEHLEALRVIDQAILSNFDLRVTIRLVLEKIISILKVDNAIFLLLDTKNHYFEYLDGQGIHLTRKPQKFIRIDQHIARQVVNAKSKIVCSLQNEEKRQWHKHYVQSESMHEYIGLPLIAKDKVIGILEVYHRAPIKLDADEHNFLHSLAGQSAIAIDNIILLESMKEANIHMKQSYDSTIEGWARALELRDQETEGHTRRVTELTVLLSKEIGLNDEEIENARIGAVLHDIGKMGIPDSILLKPGKLTPDEMEIIKRHTIYGYEMLLPIEFLSDGLDVVYYHHEKWDGSGYPTGKKGEDIPLPARIFCIVDVWDALTSERPYKKAWSKDEALKYIQEETGKQFDPAVAAAFLHIIHTRVNR